MSVEIGQASDATTLNTIVIPSKGRVQQLLAYLSYLSANQVSYPVMVLESGSHYPQLRTLFPALDLSHIRYDEEIPFFRKVADGLGRVPTEFVSLCPDDDVTTSTGMRESVRFLSEHQDYSACQGYHALFSITGQVFNLVRVAWFTPSLDQADALARLNELVRRYQPVCWATFRTEAFRRTFDTVAKTDGLLFRELAWSANTVLEGKVHRLPLVYCWRRLDDIQLLGHPLYAFIEEPSVFLDEFARYRDALLKRLLQTSALNDQALTRTLDLIHWRYFARELDLGVMNFFTDTVLARPDASIADVQVYNTVKPRPPNTESGWKAEAARGGRTYHVFPDMLDPQPCEEIHLPLSAFDDLLADLDRYPLN
ncbi:MAG: TIGR00180 family glycosyltransferase [Burkholderiales bacterium]